MTSVRTNPDGTTRTVVTDPNTDLPSSVTDEAGSTWTYTYDSSKRLSQATAPSGRSTSYTYDARGNITAVTQVASPGSGLANIVTSASFPSTCSNALTCNKPTWTKDAKGNQTDYTYDTIHGGVLTVTEPADADGTRPQTGYNYALTGGVYLPTGTSQCVASGSCVGTVTEVKSTISYNGNLLPTTITTGAGDGSLTATASITYDAVGNVQTVDGPLAGSADTTVYRYDTARRLAGIVSPDPDGTGSRKPIAQRITFNPDDQITLIESGTVADQSDASWGSFSSQEQIATTYDANARPIRTAITAGGTTYAVFQQNYDAGGRVKCFVQRMDSAQWAGQSDACAAQTSGPNGPDRVTLTTYDPLGRVAGKAEAVGTADVATVRSHTYNANGLLATATDAEGNKTTYEYDGFDRLAKTIYPSTTKGAGTSNASDYEQLGYDANGTVISRRLRDGTSIGYGYDNLNRMVSKNLPGSEIDATYSYDLLGRPTGAVQGSQTLTFVHDALGRRTSEAASYLGTVSYTYDAAGRRTSMTYPGSALMINYDFDATGNVTAIRENGATSGVGLLASYAFDDLGRRTSVTFGNGSAQSFGYDPISRLATLTNDLGGGATTHDLTQSFAYNPANQIASVTRSNDAYAWQAHYNVDRAYVADGLNRIMSAGGLGLGYDARGNLISAGANSYGYSSENLLTHAGGMLRYVYDPIGRLKASNNVNWFVYDGANLIAEVDPVGTTTRRYVHGPGTDNPIVEYAGSTIDSGTRRFLMADERGSIISVTDSTGATVNINAYDEYGIPAPGNVGRFGYTGQTWLPELGMWYYKARIYSPTLGRFMQTDPIGYNDGMNWYNYVGSDPVNGVDPFGLEEGAGQQTIFQSELVVTAIRSISISGLSGMDLSLNTSFAASVFGGITVGDGVSFASKLNGSPRLSQSARAAYSERELVVTARKVWINYAPGFFSHVSSRHFGADFRYGSIFSLSFQNEISLYSLATFAANSAPLRPTRFPGVYRYTARYTGVVGYVQGTGEPTNLVTLIVKDTGRITEAGMRDFMPVTLYPGAGRW